MKIKGLLLGSAAAVVMAGGAAAADLPAAAPADYVMICGDFSQAYVIPGTDVCLDIGGMVSMEVDVTRAGGATAVNYSTDADIYLTASTATEYGALIAHIELEADDIVASQGVAAAASALMYDDVYIQFGGDLFVKAGYYDGVGDVGDDLATTDFTGQGDTIGMGYGSGALSFAADVLLDSDNVTAGNAVEGAGVHASYAINDNLSVAVMGSFALAAAPGAIGGAASFGAGAEVSYTMDALSVLVGAAFSNGGAGANVFGGRVNVTYAVTDALSVYIDGEYQNVAASNYHVDAGVDYTVTSGLVVGANAGVAEVAGANSIMFGVDATRSF